MGRVAQGQGFLIRVVRHVIFAIVATVPGRGLGLTSDLFLSFPVASVNALCETAQALKLSWFAYAADFVFDTVRQTSVKLVMKGGVTITLELGCEAVEFHNVANNSLCVLHSQIVELVLGVPDGVIVRSEMSRRPGVARDNGLSSSDHRRAIYAYVCFVSTYLFRLTRFTFMTCFAT